MKIKMYDYEPIGLRVKQMRKAKHYTQEQLSELIDMNPKSISLLERGLCGLSVNSLMALCKELDTSSDYILFGNSGKDNNPVTEMLSELSLKEQMYACEILEAYVKSCKDK